MVEAAVEVGVEHFVYSGLASASLITKGEIPVECFDGTPYLPYPLLIPVVLVLY